LQGENGAPCDEGEYHVDHAHNRGSKFSPLYYSLSMLLVIHHAIMAVTVLYLVEVL